MRLKAELNFKERIHKPGNRDLFHVIELRLPNQDLPTFRNNLEPDHQRILKLGHKLQTPLDHRQVRTLEQFIQTHLPQPGFRLEPVRINVRQRAFGCRVLMNVRVRRAGDFAHESQTSSQPFSEGGFACAHHAVQDQDPSRLEAPCQNLGKLLEGFGRGDGRRVHGSSLPNLSVFRILKARFRYSQTMKPFIALILAAAMLSSGLASSNLRNQFDMAIRTSALLDSDLKITLADEKNAYIKFAGSFKGWGEFKIWKRPNATGMVGLNTVTCRPGCASTGIAFFATRNDYLVDITKNVIATLPAAKLLEVYRAKLPESTISEATALRLILELPRIGSSIAVLGENEDGANPKLGELKFDGMKFKLELIK
jgi:hypothetical protein